MVYYDRIYGQVNLDPILEEMILLCPEIKRLRYVGMMNFRSLGMLGLTSISRLEHVIGTAYLSQIFSYNNNMSSKSKNNLLAAALYHDVNCAPFGHAIEWAIDRYTEYKHENSVDWMLNKDNKVSQNRPKFFEENGLHRYKFEDNYNLDLSYIIEIIQGVNSFTINNDGIDLDNIDNVYRMASCLGLLNEDKSYPLLLANNLKVVSGFDNFVIKDKYYHLIEHWYKLRSMVYSKFIYSREYFAYECVLFELIAEYVKHCEVEDITNLWTQTDDLLLTACMSNKYNEVHKLAKKLLMFDYDNVYCIIRSNDFSNNSRLLSVDFHKELASKSIDKYNGNETSPPMLNKSKFKLHVTTDNKKTSRKIPIFMEDNLGNIDKSTIGHNEQYILIGLMGKEDIPQKYLPLLISSFNEVLLDNGFTQFNHIPFEDEKVSSFEQLGLF